MKNKIVAVAGAVMLAMAGVAGGAFVSNAEAQSAQRAPVILVVDQSTVLSQSKAGKTIPTQAQSIKASIEKELQVEAEKLKKDIDSFQKNASLMSDEVRQKTEQELAGRYQYGLPQRAQIMEQAWAGAAQKAQVQIWIEAEPILKDIYEKRGASLILDRSQVVYAAPEMDVTQEVIAALDKKFPSVEVQKVSLADLEKQIAEAQAKARNN